MNIQRKKQALEKISRILDETLQVAANDQASPHKYALAVKDGRELRIFFPSKKRSTIGRHLDNDVHFKSPGVSRYHATLYKWQDNFWIFDGVGKGNPSKNGIFINQQRCRHRQLTHGDRITFNSDAHAIFLELKTKTNTSSEEALIQQALGLYFENTKIEKPGKASRNSSFLNALPELVMRLDEQGTVLTVKPSRDPALQALDESIVSTHVSQWFASSVTQLILAAMAASAATGEVESFECDLNTSKQLVPCEIRIIPSKNAQFFVIVRNIQERKFLEQRLLNDVLYDELTGLPKRKLLVENIEQLLRDRRKKRDRQFAILFIDLDRFKMVNDSLGHAIGDQFIIHIAKRLRKSLRPGDIIARLGGDEFAILIHNVGSHDEAIGVTKRIQAKLTAPLKLGGHELLPSASIGIAFSTDNDQNVDDILRNADIAMYQAKSLGRGRFELFDHRMHQEAVDVLQLETDLRRAIRENEFQLLYQPIVCLKSQKLMGFEALIRWVHPKRGIVNPIEFIPQAEETGLIVGIGEWALEQACHQLSLWQQMTPDAHSLTMNVNLSSKQFSSPNLTQHISMLLHNYAIRPSSLKLEITESIIMENNQFSIDMFAQLRQLGVQICIDDFGTGYSSLSYLHRFPIDALKIDRSFITEMDEAIDNTGFAIAQSVIGLAHNLGVKVVAEGIENARHLVWLRSFQCDYGQGYFFAKPLNTQAATALVQGKLEWSYLKSQPQQTSRKQVAIKPG